VIVTFPCLAITLVTASLARGGPRRPSSTKPVGRAVGDDRLLAVIPHASSCPTRSGLKKTWTVTRRSYRGTARD